MSSVQLSFSLRTTSSVKTVHLLGSWDGYAGQLPLAKNKESSKSGSWKGTFKFQGTTLKAGQRYWYYYIIDGYHVAHDPAEPSTTEPTTGRVLNILDVEGSKFTKSSSSSKSSSSKSSSHSSSASSRHSSSSSSSKHHSTSSSKHSSSSSSRDSRRADRHRDSGASYDIPKGRPLSSSKIQSPFPVTPYATKTILEESYYPSAYTQPSTIGDLTSRFSRTTMEADEYYYSSSPPLSSGSSLSSRSGSSLSSKSSASSYSSGSGSNCSCERYGITRTGDRIKLDCGGARCGYSSEECCSSSEDEHVPTRRHGVYVR